MPTRLIVSDPEPPTWWALHKGVTCTVIGLVIGLWIGSGCAVQDLSPTPGTSPSPSLTGTSAPSTANTPK